MNMSPAARWYRNKCGLTDAEGKAFAALPDPQATDREIEEWREKNGLPAANSPLGRGMALDAIKNGGEVKP